MEIKGNHQKSLKIQKPGKSRNPQTRKKITLQDIKEGFKMFKDGRGEEEKKSYLDHLYI